MKGITVNCKTGEKKKVDDGLPLPPQPPPRPKPRDVLAELDDLKKLLLEKKVIP